MVRNKKERKHHPKSSTEHNVIPKKKVASRKTALLTRLLPRNRKGVIRASIAAIVFVALVGAIPFPYAFAKSTTLDFVTENQKTLALN